MKIVLLKDIPGVGRKHEVKNVSDGYALNFLIPKKVAEIATANAIGRAERMKSEEGMEKKIQEDLLLKNLASLKDVVIEITGKANEKGHLFAGIHAESIVKALKAQKGIDVLPEFLALEKNIKELGEHEIPVRVQDKTGSFKLIVRTA